jgi:glutamyl-tRNA synthetase
VLLRIDDTNPSKEKGAFQNVIIENLALIGVKPDKVSYTLITWTISTTCASELSLKDDPYAKDTDQEIMQKQRWDGHR